MYETQEREKHGKERAPSLLYAEETEKGWGGWGERGEKTKDERQQARREREREEPEKGRGGCHTHT